VQESLHKVKLPVFREVGKRRVAVLLECEFVAEQVLQTRVTGAPPSGVLYEYSSKSQVTGAMPRNAIFHSFFPIRDTRLTWGRNNWWPGDGGCRDDTCTEHSWYNGWTS